MSCEPRSRIRRWAMAMAVCAATAALLAGRPVHAAPALPALARFDAGSWQRLQQSLPRPSIVVFTTTDCVHCPEVLASIDAQRRQHRPLAPLVLVVMDLPPGPVTESVGPLAAHFRHADHVYGFDGAPERLRYTVDPTWIGVTPYVALLGADRPPRFVMGRPGQEAWGWLWPRPTQTP